MADEDGAPPDSHSRDTPLREVQQEFATRAEDSRRWLIATVLTLSAGSLALQAASTEAVMDLRGTALVSAVALSLSLLFGVGSVLLQFVGAGMRTKQLGHAVQGNRDWTRFETMLEANNRAPRPEKKATWDAAKQQQAKAERQGKKERAASRLASVGEKFATPVAVLQVISWLIGFSLLMIVILK